MAMMRCAMWPASEYPGLSAGTQQYALAIIPLKTHGGPAALPSLGGTGHQVHHNYIKDGVGGSGIRFTNDFAGFTFEYPGDVIHFYENTIENCGTSYDLWNEKRGAIEFFAGLRHF